MNTPANDDGDEPRPITEWSQRDLNLLHDMVQDYGRARWLRGQLKWWALWILGLPAAVGTILTGLSTIYNFWPKGK